METIKKVAALIFMTLTIINCNNEASTIEKSEDYSMIKVSDNDNLPFPWEKTFESIEYMALETTSSSLLSSPDKLKYCGGSIFWFEKMSSNLNVFDSNGKHIYKFPLGKGPGEMTQLYDFEIDKDGNIYILGFNLIKTYSKKLNFIKEITVDFQGYEKSFCPIQIKVTNQYIYLWNSSMCVRDQEYNSIYKLDLNGKVVESFFPLNHKQITQMQFFNDLVIPPRNENFIYTFNENSLEIKYTIDFGKSNLPQEIIPKEFNKTGRFYLGELQKHSYCHSISRTIETEDMLSFNYTRKDKLRQCLSTKNGDKVIQGTVENFEPHILSSTENYFVAYVFPFEREMVGNKDTYIFKLLNDNLKNMKDTDNPAILLLKFKSNI